MNKLIKSEPTIEIPVSAIISLAQLLLVGFIFTYNCGKAARK
jgi:hypothetical protein